jgi:F420-dependent oxidoreductase-like protein
MAEMEEYRNSVEALGFFGLFRSDHFTNMAPPDKESLELWVSLPWLASHTRRIQFGPFVTPISFRHPVHTARMASAVDDLSDGRLILGIGAGWQECEHGTYGFELLGKKERFDRFEEGLKLIKFLFEQDEPFDFNGDYYKVKQAIMLPRPQRIGGPSILIGGIGKKRSLPLAACYAAEWNAIFLKPNEYIRLNQEINKSLSSIGRDPKSLKRSMMTGLRFAKTQEELAGKLERTHQSVEELRNKGIIIGVGDEIKEQLFELEKAGLERIMLQWLDLDDLHGLSELARTIQ